MVRVQRNSGNFELYGKLNPPSPGMFSPVTLFIGPIQMLFGDNSPEVKTDAGDVVGTILPSDRNLPNTNPTNILNVTPFVRIKPNPNFWGGLPDISKKVASAVTGVTAGQTVLIGSATSTLSGTITIPPGNSSGNLIGEQPFNNFSFKTTGFFVDFPESPDTLEQLIGSPTVIKQDGSTFEILGMLSLVGAINGGSRTLIYPGDWIV